MDCCAVGIARSCREQGTKSKRRTNRRLSVRCLCTNYPRRINQSITAVILFVAVLFVVGVASASSNPSRTVPRTRNACCSFALPHLPENAALQVVSGALTYFSLVAWFDRPRGKLLVDEGDLVAAPSRVEGAGLGLFAARSLPEGTVLGSYPGVIRTAATYEAKYLDCPQSVYYAWRFGDNTKMIDPTDSSGELGEVCFGGSDMPLSGFLHRRVLRWSVPTLLARINEPPIGAGGCSVSARENLDAREVTFTLTRDVCVGEELFMDYGLGYDRSNYSQGKLQ